MSESYRSDNEEEFFTQDASPGQTASDMLRRAREEKGLSQKEVADQLFLSATFIRYIDNAEFDKLPKQPFIKGYLRSYARVVNVSGDEVVACYQKGLDEAEEVVDAHDMVDEGLGPNNFTGPVFQTGVAGLVGLLVIIALVWWLVSDDEVEGPAPEVVSAEEVVEEPSPTAPGEEEVNASATDSIEEAGISAVELSTGELTGPASLEREPVAEAVEIEEPAPEEASGDMNDASTREVQIETVSEGGAKYITVDAGGSDQLEFSFSDECWVEVQDAQGASIYADLNRAGDVLDISGISPFRVLLGRATSVGLYYNKEKVDLDRYVTSDNTARVTLGN